MDSSNMPSCAALSSPQVDAYDAYARRQRAADNRVARQLPTLCLAGRTGGLLLHQSLGTTARTDADADRLSQQSLDFLQRIGASAERLDELVRDSLGYAKIIREELPLSPVDVCALLRGMLQTYPNLQTSEADIIIDCDQALVVGNQAGLLQCFSKLLGNAVKFTAPGVRPWVHIWVEDRDERLRIWVEDHGIGIPPDCQERIFGMFQRLHRSEEYPGTGVGLAIARKVVQRMGGTIGLQSSPGQGSRFWVELPKAISNPT